jgi:hypothetical protein
VPRRDRLTPPRCADPGTAGYRAHRIATLTHVDDPRLSSGLPSAERRILPTQRGGRRGNTAFSRFPKPVLPRGSWLCVVAKELPGHPATAHDVIILHRLGTAVDQASSAASHAPEERQGTAMAINHPTQQPRMVSTSIKPVRAPLLQHLSGLGAVAVARRAAHTAREPVPRGRRGRRVDSGANHVATGWRARADGRPRRCRRPGAA